MRYLMQFAFYVNIYCCHIYMYSHTFHCISVLSVNSVYSTFYQCFIRVYWCMSFV